MIYHEGRGVTRDDAEAVKWLRKAAEHGNGAAQFDLGLMYNGGDGVTRDYAEAAKWFRMAAEQGHAGAQGWLGFAFGSGQGVTRDYAEAAKWVRKAAEQGEAIGQYGLGGMYHDGQGLTRDDAEIMLMRIVGYQKPDLTPLRPEGLWDAYIRMDGVADYYQAGALADWKFLHDGSPWTICMVFHRSALITTDETVLDTADSTSTQSADMVRMGKLV